MSSLVPIVCNQVVTVLLGVLGVKLISAFVPEATFGYYARFLTLTQLGVMVTHSGVVNHALRYWQRETSQAGVYTRFLWTASWQGMVYLAPLLLVVSAGAALMEREFAWLWVFPWLGLGNAAMILGAIATGVLNADRKLWDVFVLSCVSTAARILVPIGLALLAGVTFSVLSTGFAVHGLIVFGCLAFMFRWALREPRIPSQAAQHWRQELKEYGRPFVLLGIGAWLLQSADRWIVGLFYDERQVGLFAFATNLGAIVPTFIVGGVMQRVFPEVFRQADQARTREEWERIARYCDQATGLFLALTIAGLVVLNALGPHLVGWLISAKYAPALEIVVPAGFAMITSQINQFYYLLLQGQHNSVGMVKVMMVVSGIKTLGSLVTAAISWPAFLAWLIASTAVGGLIGRCLIRKMALPGEPSGPRK